KVIEFNVRFGDPETQPVLLRLQSDLVDLVEAALDGRLEEAEAVWDPRPSLGVVMAARPYPDTPVTGDVISGLDPAGSAAAQAAAIRRCRCPAPAYVPAHAARSAGTAVVPRRWRPTRPRRARASAGRTACRGPARRHRPGLRQ